MQDHEKHMRRCLELASLGYTQRNPKVGCVIVLDDQIIGEGYHEQYGGPHAEVNAFQSVSNPQLIANATVYVSLEPCSFQGKTPACTDLFEKNPCKRVVIGMLDPNPKVSGSGVAKLESLGIEVVSDVLREECLELNRAFHYSIKHQKTYGIAKWAETADGFIGAPEKRILISNDLVNVETQKWRSQIEAYLIGHQTLKTDQALLNSRLIKDCQPLRCVIGNHINQEQPFFEIQSPILLFGENKSNLAHVECAPFDNPQQIVHDLYARGLGQLMIEGGNRTIKAFLEANCIQEIRRIINPNMELKSGIKAPIFDGFSLVEEHLFRDQLLQIWRQ